MATGIVTAAGAPANTLKQFSDARGNELYDVVALLRVAVDRMPDDDEAHQTLRVVQMALEKVKSIADELFEATP